MVWRADYEPFETTVTTSEIENEFRFSGQYRDEETGLHQNWFREYAAGLGRYILADPIGLRGGINPYGYVQNNSVNVIDPEGKTPTAVAGALVGGGLGGPPGALIGGLVGLGIGIVGGEALWNNVIEPWLRSDKLPTLPSDPSQSPGEGWEWRGKDPPGGKRGSWHNPDTGESLHPDLEHPEPTGPHWDYTDPQGKKHRLPCEK